MIRLTRNVAWKIQAVGVVLRIALVRLEELALLEQASSRRLLIQ